MRRIKRAAVLTSIAVISVMVLGAAAIANDSAPVQDRTPPEAADQNNPPPRPAWIRANGSVDHSRAPECIEAVGADGLTITKGNGEPLCIPFKELHGPPPGPPPSDVAKANKGATEINGPDGTKTMVVPERRPTAIGK